MTFKKIYTKCNLNDSEIRVNRNGNANISSPGDAGTQFYGHRTDGF